MILGLPTLVRLAKAIPRYPGVVSLLLIATLLIAISVYFRVTVGSYFDWTLARVMFVLILAIVFVAILVLLIPRQSFLSHALSYAAAAIVLMLVIFAGFGLSAIAFDWPPALATLISGKSLGQDEPSADAPSSTAKTNPDLSPSLPKINQLPPSSGSNLDERTQRNRHHRSKPSRLKNTANTAARNDVSIVTYNQSGGMNVGSVGALNIGNENE